MRGEPVAQTARILVVDDKSNSALLSATLRLVEFDVRVADSGHRAPIAMSDHQAVQP